MHWKDGAGALAEKAQVLGIDDKNGINACKLLGVAFTTAIGVLVRMRERSLLTVGEALVKLATLGNHGRYKNRFWKMPDGNWRQTMSKTMSIRMDRENFDFLIEFTKEQRSDLSKAVRDMVTRGRILLAVERYKQGEASLGRAAELAGVPLGQMMTILTEYGVESRIQEEDYLQGLEGLRKVW
jgi:predicted HTH domain antitoxin